MYRRLLEELGQSRRQKESAIKDATDRGAIAKLAAEIRDINEKLAHPQRSSEEFRATVTDLLKAVERCSAITPESLAEIRTKAAAGDLSPAEAFLARVIQHGKPEEAALAAYHLGNLARVHGELRRADGYYRVAVQFEPASRAYREALNEIGAAFAATPNPARREILRPEVGDRRAVSPSAGDIDFDETQEKDRGRASLRVAGSITNPVPASFHVAMNSTGRSRLAPI